MGEPEAFRRIVNIPAQILSEATTVSFLIDEHVTRDGIWGGIGLSFVLFFCYVVAWVIRAGNQGRQEGEDGQERDLGEHVFGVDSAKLLWSKRWATTVRMGSQDKERAVGRGSAWRRSTIARNTWVSVDRLYAIEGC